MRENVLNRWIQRRQVKVGILTNRKVQVLLDNSREHLKKEFRLSLSRTSPLLYATTHSNSQATWKLSCCTSRFTQGQGLKVGMIECFWHFFTSRLDFLEAMGFSTLLLCPFPSQFWMELIFPEYLPSLPSENQGHTRCRGTKAITIKLIKFKKLPPKED